MLVGRRIAGRLIDDAVAQPIPTWLLVLSFLAGLGVFIHVRLGARLSVTELLLPFMLLANLKYWAWVKANPELKKLLVSGALFCGAIAISDAINKVPPFDFVKGIAVPVLMRCYLVLFALMFVQSTRCLYWLIIGLTVGSYIHLFFNTGADDFDFGSDHGYTFFVFRVTPALFCTASLAAYYGWNISRVVPVLVFVALGAIILRFGSRSYAATCLIGGALMWVAVYPSRAKIAMAFRPLRYWARGALVVAVLGWAATSVYVFMAGKGYLGSFAQDRFHAQGGDDGFATLLMRGRSEALGAALMIYDKPLLGHGSTSYRSRYFADAARFAGNTYYSRKLREEAMRLRTNWGHSIVLTSWANAGFMAAVFWFLSIAVVCRMAVVLLVTGNRALCLIMVFVMSFAWDAIYSPLSVQMRAVIPMLEAVGVIMVPKIQQCLRDGVYKP